MAVSKAFAKGRIYEVIYYEATISTMNSIVLMKKSTFPTKQNPILTIAPQDTWLEGQHIVRMTFIKNEGEVDIAKKTKFLE